MFFKLLAKNSNPKMWVNNKHLLKGGLLPHKLSKRESAIIVSVHSLEEILNFRPGKKEVKQEFRIDILC